MYKLKISCNSNITITNCAEFTLELKEFVEMFFTKVKEIHPMNDDRYLYFVEHHTDEFLLQEIKECNRFGLKLLFDDVCKARALEFIKSSMAISNYCSEEPSDEASGDEPLSSGDEPFTSGDEPSPDGDDPWTDSSSDVVMEEAETMEE